MNRIVLFLFLSVALTSAISASDSTDLIKEADSMSGTNQTDSTNRNLGVVEADPPAQSSSIYPMSPERKVKLIAYSQFVNVWRFVSFFLEIFILLAILFTGLSARLRDYSKKLKNPFLALWLFFSLFVLIDYLFNLPFTIYREVLVEGEYGFFTQSIGSWFIDSFKSLGLTILFGIIPVYFIYRLVNQMKRWWLAFSLGAIPFIVFTIIVVPIFISPLFNDFEPIKDQQLKTELLTLADKAGIDNPDIFQVNASKQSTKINAYVTGMFGSKRIVLYDTMIDNFETDEILFVMGHEMGHYIMNHIWISFFISIIFIAFALWLTDKTIHPFINRYKNRFKFDSFKDYASLPLLLIFLSVISFVFNPVANGISRYQEHQSDIYGMDITSVEGESAATAFDKLSVFNLSDPDPHPLIEFWFYSHPSLKTRMEFVRNYSDSVN